MRWIFRLIGVVVFLVLLAVGALFLLPAERIAQLATERFEAETGRELTIRGEVSPQIWPNLAIRIEDVSLANASWSTQGPMLTAERLEVGVSLAALTSETVDVKTLELVSPRILFEISDQGEANWAIVQPVDAEAVADGDITAEEVGLPDIRMNAATLTDGSFTFIDHRSDTVHRLEALDANIALPNLAEAARVDGSGLYNGTPVRVGLGLDTPAKMLGGQLTDITLSMASGGTSVDLEGQAALEPVGFNGRIVLKSAERAQLFQALGQQVPDLPRGLGRDVIELNSALVVASDTGSVHLREMVLGLDNNQITGAVDVMTQGAKPKLVAQLQADRLDLVGLSQQGRNEATQGEAAALNGASGWSTETIDVSALQLFDAELRLNSGPVDLGDAKLDQLSMASTLTNGRMVNTLQPLALYGGQVVGDLVVNSNGGLSTRANLTMSDLELLPFLTEFVDFDRLDGATDATVSLLAVGNSLDTLIRSVDGEGQFSVGQGELLGLDIPGMIRNLDFKYRGEGAKTVFNGITSTFTVTDGVVNNSNMQFDAPLLKASGAGLINLGAQSLDYQTFTTILQDNGANGLTLPIQIFGPWSDPSIVPQLAALVGQDLEELEDRAKAAVQEELSELLGAQVTDETSLREAVEQSVVESLGLSETTSEEAPPQNLEEAVKDKLEDELRRGLGSLFGNN